jgi:glycosyltransferase involved in cell wall biosynthesis
MKLCLISTELLGWGHAGGFGFATRSIGRELSRRGVEVSALIPWPRGHREPCRILDGFTVYGYGRRDFRRFLDLIREVNADVYHSQQPSFASFLARRAMPDRRHVISVVDPRVGYDWITEFSLPTLSALAMLPAFVYYENPFTGWAVRHAHAVFTPARCLIEKTRRKYRLATKPGFLPSPTPIPDTIAKAPTPTVCSVGRLDRRKRPELFLELARQFPEVEFVAVGGGQDPRFLSELQARSARLGNLTLTGFLDQFSDPQFSQILSRSWILVNTAAREGLPYAFVEAAGHRCAILSGVDPDGFASRFGHHVTDGDFATGLRRLLEADRWRELGQHGFRAVAADHGPSVATDRHLSAYASLLG